MKRTPHDSDILAGMARGPWASHWGDQAEEKGERLSGVDLYEAAPRTPRWASRWAKKLADALVNLNDASLASLYDLAVQQGYPRDSEAFGFHLGMQAVGHGVSWTDDVRGHPDLKILIPDYEFYPGAERNSPDLRFVGKRT